MFDLTDVAVWLNLSIQLPKLAVAQVVTDSRHVAVGYLFVALKGERVDGHDFLRDAAKQGAVAALVLERYEGEDFGLILIRVPNVLVALQTMAKKRLEGLRLKVIAVTGSVGKTTTKEFIAQLLSARFHVAKSPGNANSQVGTPTTILNIEGAEEVLVLEMGMSQMGELANLVEMAPPEIAVITKIGHSHAEFFVDGIDGIAKEKAKIFSHPATKWGVINAQVQGYPVVLKEGTCEKIIAPQKGAPPKFPFQATHLIENFCLAETVAYLMGMTDEEIENKAGELSLCKNRFELVQKEGIFFLNDSYNASPESMCSALDNIPPHQGKAIAVLGEMKELGNYSEAAHLDVAKYAINKVDYLLCLGKGCRPMEKVFREYGKPFELYEDFAEIKRRVYDLASQGDLVLLKGSNSNRLWKILEHDQVGEEK